MLPDRHVGGVILAQSFRFARERDRAPPSGEAPRSRVPAADVSSRPLPAGTARSGRRTLRRPKPARRHAGSQPEVSAAIRRTLAGFISSRRLRSCGDFPASRRQHSRRPYLPVWAAPAARRTAPHCRYRRIGAGVGREALDLARATSPTRSGGHAAFILRDSPAGRRRRARCRWPPTCSTPGALCGEPV